MRLLPSSGGGAPTGLPLEVADEAARLALTPQNGARVKQVDTGMIYGYVAEEGGLWNPAPDLTQITEPEQVLEGYGFQSATHPTFTYGTLTLPGSILPGVKWLENIEKFIGYGGVSLPALTVSDTAITFIDPAIVLRNFNAQAAATPYGIYVELSCSLDASNVDLILDALNTSGFTVTGGAIELTGSNAAPTKQDVLVLPSSSLGFGGTYARTGTDGQGRGIYSGNAMDAPYDSFRIEYDYMNAMWKIINDTAVMEVAYSVSSEMFPWVDSFTDATNSYTPDQLENAAKLSLIAKGLAVNTN